MGLWVRVDSEWVPYEEYVDRPEVIASHASRRRRQRLQLATRLAGLVLAFAALIAVAINYAIW